MGAYLRIESELDRAWEVHGDEYRQAVADRDHFASETRDRLGPDVAAQVQFHVDATMGRLLGDDLADLDPAAERRCHELRALEMAVVEIEARIESAAVFYDSYVGGLFPMSWWRNVVPLLPETPGLMPVENVKKFLELVRGADQRLPSGDGGEETAEDFRERRRELVEFLERAVKLGEVIWCDL
jgi:hypothetical protein